MYNTGSPQQRYILSFEQITTDSPETSLYLPMRFSVKCVDFLRIALTEEQQ